MFKKWIEVGPASTCLLQQGLERQHPYSSTPGNTVMGRERPVSHKAAMHLKGTHTPTLCDGGHVGGGVRVRGSFAP
ncbi:MAG: hypothetical protein WDW38_004190 [Sanguina aurantia]